MANEITLSVHLAVSNGIVQFVESTGFKNFDQTTAGGPAGGEKSIGTSEASVTFPDLTNEGFTFIKNNDATNYVDIGFATGVYGLRLKPGEFCVLRLVPATTLYCLANTAACRVVFYCLEA